ncbi:MAG TPA: LytTR family DNA-binding domain-containing protein [Longimicrobium sp.]
MGLRIMVVDDEEPARRTLRRLIERQSGVEGVEVAADGEGAVEAIRRQRPDLVFLDVQMPKLDGFGVVERVGPREMPPVVFVTAYDPPTLRAFDAAAVDYLVKPFNELRFRDAFAQAVARLEASDGAAASGALETVLRLRGAAQAPPSRLLVKVGDRMKPVVVDEIRYITVDGHYLHIHTAEGPVQVRSSISEMERRLDPERFVRVHRSTIVNLDHVREIQPWFGGDRLIILRDGTELKLSRTHRERLDRFLLGEAK